MAVALFNDGENPSQVQIFLDSAKVWDRELAPCEIEALYYSNEFAIKLGPEIPHPTMDIPAVVVGSPSTLRVSAWVFMPDELGSHTLASQPLEAGSPELSFSVGLIGNAMTMAVYVGCTCEPCSCYRELTSRQSRVFAGVWTHVTYVYDGSKTSFMMNGIVSGEQVWATDIPVSTSALPIEIGGASNAPLEHRVYGDLYVEEQDFDGLLASFSVDYDFEDYLPEEDMDTVACLYAHGGLSFPLQENFGAAQGHQRSYEPKAETPTISASAMVWQNVSYDDATYGLQTKIYGAGIEVSSAGTPAVFAIETFDRCNKARLVSDDDVTVTITSVDDPGIVYDVDLIAGAGAYFGSFNISQCGSYNTAISVHGYVVKEITTDVEPGPADVANSFTQGLVEKCAGLPTYFEIVPVDAYGCKADAFSLGDLGFTVHVTGPYDDVYMNTLIDEFGKYYSRGCPRVDPQMDMCQC